MNYIAITEGGDAEEGAGEEDQNELYAGIQYQVLEHDVAYLADESYDIDPILPIIHTA